MMLRGHNLTPAGGHCSVEWRPCAVVSFGLYACPNTPSIRSGMHLVGADRTGSTKSAEPWFSDRRPNVH